MKIRRTRMRSAVGLFAILLVVAPPGPLVRGAWGAVVPGVDRAQLQKVMDAYTSDSVSGALAEVVDEHGRWTGTSGVAQLGKHGPPPASGQFRVGSITKSFVSTVVLQLVGEGKLTLDDTVERWLPGMVPGGGGITIRQLLNHTSGIFNYTDDQEVIPLDGVRFLDETRFKTYSPADLVKIATAHPPLFPPGQGWSYSNTNYILAGLVLEKVTGRAYSLEIEDRIIRPLGLRHTYLPGESAGIRGPHSHGYLLVYDANVVRTVDVTEINPSWAGSAGEIVSTAADINRFYAALLGGRLLQPSELAAMETTVDTGTGFRYGLGLGAIPLPCGVTVWGHNGGINGYLTVSAHTADGTHQLTGSINPLFERGDNALNDLVLAEFCGPTPPGQPGAQPQSLRAAAVAG